QGGPGLPGRVLESGCIGRVELELQCRFNQWQKAAGSAAGLIDYNPLELRPAPAQLPTCLRFDELGVACAQIAPHGINAADLDAHAFLAKIIQHAVMEQAMAKFH